MWCNFQELICLKKLNVTVVVCVILPAGLPTEMTGNDTQDVYFEITVHLVDVTLEY